MSGIIAGAGSSTPNTFVYLDWNVPSFTVASGATGNDFAIGGTVKSVAFNNNYNVTPNAVSYVTWIATQLSCVVTTNTTDNTTLFLENSLDGGTTWNQIGSLSLALTGAHQNYSFSNFRGVGDSLSAVGPITNPIQFRLSVNDATSPTTNALTITNIRVSSYFTIIK